MRPFGALIFGRSGDLIGRKYTFLVTIVVNALARLLVWTVTRGQPSRANA